MKRTWIAMCCAVALSATLCACSADSGTATTPTETPDAETVVDVTELPVDETSEPIVDDAETETPAATDDMTATDTASANLTESVTLEGLTYLVDPAWTSQETTTEMPASDGSGNLTAVLRSYISGSPADMNMLQVQAQQIDPAIATLLNTMDEATLKSALGSMGTTTTTTSTEYGDVTSSMESMTNPPAGARAAWTYTAEYSESVPMKGAEIVTDTNIYLISTVGTLTELWPQIEASLALS